MRKSLRSLLLAAALVLVVLVVGDYLGSAGLGPRAEPRSLPVLPEDVAAQSSSWRWTQSTGDSTHIEVSAEDFEQDSDGLGTDLRDVTVKIFHDASGKFDRVDSAAMRMLADGDLYSEGETVIRLGVPVSGMSGRPVEVTTSGVTFRPSGSSARTERSVRYEFDGGRGTSVGAVYDAGSGTLELLSAVAIERDGTGAGTPPVTIRAGGLRYREAGGRIDLVNGATIRQGARWLECSEAVVHLQAGRMRQALCSDSRGGEVLDSREARVSAPELEADFGATGELIEVKGTGGAGLESVGEEQGLDVKGDVVHLRYEPGDRPGTSHLRHVEAHGAARASMGQDAAAPHYSIASSGILLRLEPESSLIEEVETLDWGTLRQSGGNAAVPSRTLQAGRILLKYAGGGIESLSATSGTELVQSATAEDRGELRTWSDSLGASFDPVTAEIAALHQTGAFRFEESDRAGRADEAKFQPTGGLLDLSGDASVVAAGSSVLADRIVVDRDSGRLEAWGGVIGSMVSESGAEGGDAVPAGLFGGGEPLFLAAGRLLSDPDDQIVTYREGARLWQGHNRIDAATITIRHPDRQFEAVGEVAATWLDAGDGAGHEDFVSVRSERMLHREGVQGTRFSGAVDFRRGPMRVLADDLRTRLGSSGGRAERRLEAEGSVRIAQESAGGALRGSGNRAEFDLAESAIVLEGDPARIAAPDGTLTEGVRLTYRATGDSLHVSGRGAQRAYSYRPAPR